MIVNDILQLSRDMTGTTLSQYPNTTLLPWANIVYRRIIKYLSTDRQENLYITTQLIDAAVVNSYTLNTDILRIKDIRIYTTPTDAYPTPSREIDFRVQPFAREYYLLNQNNLDPRHQVINGQLFIAPAFTSATAGSTGNHQIIVDYEQRQTDLAVGGAESTIKIPLEYHHIIAFGVKPFIEAHLKMINGKRASDVDFEMVVIDMIDQLANLDSTKMEINVPYETALE